MKIEVIFFVLLFSIPLLVSSQGVIEFRIKNFDADSLASAINGKEGKDKVDALNILSNVLCRKDIDSSVYCATKAIRIAEKLRYQKGFADGHFYLGNDYYLKDSLRPTIINYLKALRIYEDMKPSEEFANLCLQLAVVNVLNERWDSALPYCQQSIGLYDKINDTAGIITSTVGLALIFNYLGEIDSAILYNQIALKLLGQHPNSAQLGCVYNEFGRLNGQKFYNTGDSAFLAEAISWFAKGLENPTSGYKVMLTYNIGAYYSEYKSTDSVAKGQEYMDELFAISDTGRFVYAEWAWECYDEGNVDSAIILFHKALIKTEEELANFTMDSEMNPLTLIRAKYGCKETKQDIHKALYTIHSERGNFKLALDHYILYKQIEEEIHLKKTHDLINLLEVESKDEKKNSKIIIMGQENELKDSKISQARMANYGLIAFVIVIGLVGAMFVRQNKMRNEHKTVLLEQKLLRLQMNPHFIFNALSNILIFIDKKNTDSASRYLTSFSKLLRTTLESTRQENIILEEEINAIQNYLELQILAYKNKFEYHVEVDANIDPDNMAIPPMLIQPFIENAIQHGIRHKTNKGHILIKFRLENNKVICEVEDDGVGREKAWEVQYKTNKEHKSMATDIIRDRIQSINKKMNQKINLAIIDLKSDNNEPIGTKVILDLPLI